jgi:hypothetical protein
LHGKLKESTLNQSYNITILLTWKNWYREIVIPTARIDLLLVFAQNPLPLNFEIREILAIELTFNKKKKKKKKKKKNKKKKNTTTTEKEEKVERLRN